MDFSVVIPIAERDAELIERTLPSWLKLPSDDYVFAVDEPITSSLLESILQSCGVPYRPDGSIPEPALHLEANGKTLTILQVPKKWKFQHAMVRRVGFLAAKNDRILTGDADLIVNESCMKAIVLVGQNNIGAVSLSKRRGEGLVGVYRNVTKKLVRTARQDIGGYFSGLYALYRPYWLDSENRSILESSDHPYQTHVDYLGEDTFLRDEMVKKHRVVYLPDVGAVDLHVASADRTDVQAREGRKMFREGRPFVRVLVRSLLYYRPALLGAYIQEVRRRRRRRNPIPRAGKTTSSK